MDNLHKNEYLTITKTSEGFFKDKGSKFFAYAIPFEDASKLKDMMAPLKKEHHQARHHCFAYRIGTEEYEERSNDDGEPGHSAGTPILGQIQSHQLTNVLIVVVRYFGGTKLGVSGLINAYKTSAKAAIENAKVIRREIEKSISFSFDYSEMNDVMRIVKKHEPRIINQNMHLRVEMMLSIRRDLCPPIIEELRILKTVTFED